MIPRCIPMGAAALLVAALAACGPREREAEVKTGVSEAEVSTTLPSEQVSDGQLQAAAKDAAADAGTPTGGSVPVDSSASRPTGAPVPKN